MNRRTIVWGLICIAICLPGCGGSSDGGGTTNTVEESAYFPDESLEAVIRNEIGKPTGDITLADLEEITALDAVPLIPIADLEGIQYCKNLTQLSISLGSFSDVSHLSGLTKLTKLGLFSSQLSDPSPLAGLTNLTELLLGYMISDASPLSGLTYIGLLELEDNQISDITPLLENVDAYERIFLNGNPLDANSCDVLIPELESQRVTVSSSCDG